MSVLPDHAIERASRRSGLISPYSGDQLQPASYDVLLAPSLLIPRNYSPRQSVDLRDGRGLKVDKLEMSDDGYRILPLHFVLGSTVERVSISDCLVGRIEGKSSWARAGVQIHSAGYLDPGFRGNVTLEIVNLSPAPVMIWIGARIAQLSFSLMMSPCRTPYGSPGLGSHYQDADGVEGARYGDEG